MQERKCHKSIFIGLMIDRLATSCQLDSSLVQPTQLRGALGKRKQVRRFDIPLVHRAL